jgi:hypothetical protein
VYQRLRERSYEVFAVNPNANEVDGDRCYHDLQSIPGGVDAVVIATRPEIAEETMRECADLAIKHVPILYLTQALNALLLLPLLCFIYGISRDRDLMGEHANGPLGAAASLVTIALLTGCVAALGVATFVS